MKGLPKTPICPPIAVSEGKLRRCLAAAYSCSLCCLDLLRGFDQALPFVFLFGDEVHPFVFAHSDSPNWLIPELAIVLPSKG